MLYLLKRNAAPRPPHVNPYTRPNDWPWDDAIPFVSDSTNENQTTENDATETSGQKPTVDLSPDEIILARLPTLTADTNAAPCKRCGSKFKWRDCYSKTNMHCDKCSKPPSLAMVKHVFGLIEMNGRDGGDGFAWLDMTERIKPLMLSEQMREMQAKRNKQKPRKQEEVF